MEGVARVLCMYACCVSVCVLLYMRWKKCLSSDQAQNVLVMYNTKLLLPLKRVRNELGAICRCLEQQHLREGGARSID